MEKKNVYVTFIRINTPRGGDFYVALKSELIKSKEDVDMLNLQSCNTKEDVLAKVRVVDKDAKIVGGIILCRNEEIEIGGVYKPSNGDEMPIESMLNYFNAKLDDLKNEINNEVAKKGRR